MSRRREWWLQRLRDVEAEFEVWSVAATVLARLLTANPSALNPHRLERGDFARATGRLPATFVVRLFAEFEAGLREAWQRALNKASVPTTGQLLLGVAARRSITGPLFGNADRVRTYRNAIVHEGNESVEPVSVPEAVRYLRRFFSHLPPDW